MEVHDLPTPALIIDRAALDRNLTTMAAAHPGRRLRPHVKAHKCTTLAQRQRDAGHVAFTCATPHEAVGMAAMGLGEDLLVANEIVDPRRLEALAALADEASITIAVDSEATIAVAALVGIRSCVIDVDVGLPRCGCDPKDAGRLAAEAREPRHRGARRDGLRGPPDGDRGPRQAARAGRSGDGDRCSLPMPMSAGRSSRPAAPAPTTSTARPVSPRSRPGAMR